MKELNILSFIENLVNTKLPDCQIDIYLNKIVVLQIFKSSDVISWGWTLKGLHDGGIVISLVFNYQKTNNELNYSRFKNSKNYQLFEKKDLGGGDMYFLFIDENLEKATVYISDLLHEIYLLEDKEIDVFLNSYV